VFLADYTFLLSPLMLQELAEADAQKENIKAVQVRYVPLLMSSGVGSC
jgi:hypothetical protein